MNTLTNATLKSRTFWVNLLIAALGAGMVVFQDTANTLATTDGIPADAGSVGTATIVIAVVNAVLRYLTQQKQEGQTVPSTTKPKVKSHAR